ncbi:MAG: 16S rRNA (cytosine(1402)-N(4))-methyltransferase RsmH [Thermoguttaceae bacterium]
MKTALGNGVKNLYASTMEQIPAQTVHVPVLLEEAVAALGVRAGGVYVDGTLGGGGHTAKIAEAVGDTGTVIAFDRDIEAINRAETFILPKYATNTTHRKIRLVHADTRYVTEAMKQLGIEKIDGIVLDLGMSSDQLDDTTRGFRFDSDTPLDLRFDTSEGEPAHAFLARASADAIADAIFNYGEERYSRRIARQIVESRNSGNPVRTARQLAELVASCVPRERRTKTNATTIHPATRTFQGLRIAVNDELASLTSVLKQLPEVLAPRGRAAIISFHSLEDRIVKNAFRDDDNWNIITKKPITPTPEESSRNPRARSAKLRVAERK